jgi:hypothetical protein
MMINLAKDEKESPLVNQVLKGDDLCQKGDFHKGQKQAKIFFSVAPVPPCFCFS